MPLAFCVIYITYALVIILFVTIDSGSELTINNVLYLLLLYFNANILSNDQFHKFKSEQ
jgi:hypothetical protein